MIENKTKALYAEMKEKASGRVYISLVDYYRGIGVSEHLGERTPLIRAYSFSRIINGIGHNVYDNDIILGSLLGTVGDKGDIPDEELEFYSQFNRILPYREWLSGCDHYAPAYDRLLSMGVDGIIDEIHESMKMHKDDKEGLIFLESCEISMNGFSDMILKYAENAKDEEARRVCEDVAHKPASSFREALQLVWFGHLAFKYQNLYAMAFGRMDQYLYPYYRHDIDAGIITDVEAQAMLENVFIKIGENQVMYHGDDVNNIAIAGLTKDGKCGCNDLSFTILHAVGACNIPGPNLSARINKLVPDEFLIEALKVIGTGLGYPALMNDDANIAALLRMGYEEEDVNGYCMVGCIENFLPGQQPPWSDNRFNVPKYLECTLNRGKTILTNRREGLDQGDVSQYKTMDEFMAAFEKQVAHFAGLYSADMIILNARLNNSEFVNPFMSCLSYHCIERAKDLCNGGAKYPAVHGGCSMGIGTIADSLAAIEKTVFIDKSLTLAQIVEAMKANFEGYADVRQKLLDAPKYGNDDEFVDKYAIWFVKYIGECFAQYRLADGGRIYQGIASNTANIDAGKECGASPDGRLAGTPMSDAASPTYGKDTKGPTYTMASVSKPDYSYAAVGTVVNQKYPPSAFVGEENLKRLAALIRVYFARGGQEVQINSISREILADAIDNPENYSSLVVRVSGFSAYYTQLSSDIQHDILNRTEQND